jgi:hypothetical protein
MITAIELVDSLKRSCPDALRLAKQLSLAVSIEPALLRRARIEARPSIDVSAESALWFSQLVESRSFNGIAFYPEVAALLREIFVREAREAVGHGGVDLVQSAHRIICRAHREAPATIRLHEELIWLELTMGDQASSAMSEQLLEAFMSLIADSVQYASIARWFSAVGLELPDAARRTSAFQLLDVLSASLLRRERRCTPSAHPTGAFADVPRRFVVNMPRTTLWVALTSEALVIQSVNADGFYPISSPRTNPSLVEIAIDGEGFRPFAWHTGEPLWIPFIGNEITLQTLEGSRFRFRRQPQEKPSAFISTLSSPLSRTGTNLMSPKIAIDREIPLQNRPAFASQSRVWHSGKIETLLSVYDMYTLVERASVRL